MTKGFTHGDLHTKLLGLSAPIIVQNLVVYLQIQVDMAMVGQADPLYLSAIANVLYPYNIVITFLTSLGTGATVIISHSIGGRSLRSAQRYSEVSFFFNFLLAIPFFLILFQFANNLMKWMGTSESVNEYGSLFLKSLSFSVLFTGISISISAILLGIGKTKHLMVAAIITTIVNVFFDWTLIYGRLGLPEMGIQGAGTATSISNFASMVYLITALIKTRDLPFKPTIRGILNPRWSIQKRNVLVGFPFSLEAILWSLGQIIMVRMVNGLDDIAAGLYVLVKRIQSITFFFYLGIARATMILVGQEMGANNREGAFQVVSLSLKYAFSTCALASMAFLIFPEEILSIFSSERALIDRAIPLLNIVSITIFPVAVNVVIGNAIRGLKDTKWMFYTQSFGTIFVICVSAMMLFVYELDLMGVMITVLLDELIRAQLNYRRFRSHTTKMVPRKKTIS